MKHFRISIRMITGILLIAAGYGSPAQPLPGDWFREYCWTVPQIDGNERFLRVGGRFDYREQTPRFPEGQYREGMILIPGWVDLRDAVRAEIMAEKNLCHDYTTGLAVRINDGPYLPFPEAEGIPEPQEGYMHHTFPVVKVPLELLREGEDNWFSMKVDAVQPWNWPQNLVYGVTLRVYYEQGRKRLPEAGLAEGGRPEAGRSEAGLAEGGRSEAGSSEAGLEEGGRSEAGSVETGRSEAGLAEGGRSEAGRSKAGSSEAGRLGSRVIGELQGLTLSCPGMNEIAEVHYVAHYTGPDMNGDGIFTDWHYGWFRGHIRYHIGSAVSPPFSIQWDTQWVPDQEEPMKVAAMVRFADGLTCFTQPVEGLKLDRPYRVIFCKPDSIPEQWTTRSGEFENRFSYEGDPANIERMKITWRSWSPGYMNGLYLNDVLVQIREGERYVYHDHELVIDDPLVIGLLNRGVNTLKTGKTPLYNGQMVHGMDVLYPGPMVLIREKNTEK